MQGVGFRPFVWKRAGEHGLTGWVNNDSSGVTIEIEGSEVQVGRFLDGFQQAVPPLAKIDSMTVADMDQRAEAVFRIRSSEASAHQSTPVSPDISVCPACLAEFGDPANRRFQYPFINCTDCGPRFTIVEDIPYDRMSTTMKSFPMCGACQQEYDDPASRRFHAQPNACPDCGPKIWIVKNDPVGEAMSGKLQEEAATHRQHDCGYAIRQFRQAIRQGQIVAVKGIGGFHLTCDATSDKAVRKLRERKGRIDKPFAVMVASVDAARALADVSPQEQALLQSRERPIVLLARKDVVGNVEHEKNFPPHPDPLPPGEREPESSHPDPLPPGEREPESSHPDPLPPGESKPESPRPDHLPPGEREPESGNLDRLPSGALLSTHLSPSHWECRSPDLSGRGEGKPVHQSPCAPTQPTSGPSPPSPTSRDWRPSQRKGDGVEGKCVDTNTPEDREPEQRGPGLSELVAPGNNFVGVMLPYSPLHYLLVDDGRPLVLTSGNLSDEPIVRTNQEAQQRLSQIADAFLLHNREIHVVCDDSVARCVEGDLLPIRRSRGYAPMPVRLSRSGLGVLAVGGEIKSTFCVTRDDYAYMSQHIGDMGNMETLNALTRSIEHFLRLFRVEPLAVASDLHPEYLSGRWAREFASSRDLPLVRVQHHFAHVAALLAEHGLPPEHEIIGCCFDGTGYGPDEAIWGGEFMLASQLKYDRVAHLGYIPLPGGDASIRKPWRVALAQLWSHGLPWNPALPAVRACPPAQRNLLQQQLERNLNCVPTSSMGRLFDAVASLIGIRHEISYEAQAAMEMEALAAHVIDKVDPQAYRFDIAPGQPLQLDSRQLFACLCNDIDAGTSLPVMAAGFHHAVANMMVDVCRTIRDERTINLVGLTGGVFQNVLLLRLSTNKLVENGFQVLTHSVVPPNDGGLALGQATFARNSISVD